jgi:serine/threonine protein kinase
MEVEPSRRLTAAQALDHPWITADHLSHTDTSNNTAASPVPNNTSDFPKKQSKAEQLSSSRTLTARLLSTTSGSFQRSVRQHKLPRNGRKPYPRVLKIPRLSHNGLKLFLYTQTIPKLPRCGLELSQVPERRKTPQLPSTSQRSASVP